jgi:hypothetical protein
MKISFFSLSLRPLVSPTKKYTKTAEIPVMIPNNEKVPGSDQAMRGEKVKVLKIPQRLSIKMTKESELSVIVSTA